jgi:hypothetical protein
VLGLGLPPVYAHLIPAAHHEACPRIAVARLEQQRDKSPTITPGRFGW